MITSSTHSEPAAGGVSPPGSRPRTSTLYIATDRVPPRRWLAVRIHPTVADLQRAANRYRPRTGDEAAGICHPAYDPWPANGFAGTIRLAADYLLDQVIAHELVHAACAIYRRNVAPEIRLGTGRRNLHREEDLAYIYGELHEDLFDKLAQGGFDVAPR